MYKHLDRIFEIIFLSDDLEITKNCMKIVLKIFADKKIKEQEYIMEKISNFNNF